MDTDGTMKSVHNYGVFVLRRLNYRKCKDFLSLGTKLTVRNNEVSIKQGNLV